MNGYDWSDGKVSTGGVDGNRRRLKDASRRDESQLSFDPVPRTFVGRDVQWVRFVIRCDMLEPLGSFG
jgi:hypothetical protein